MSVHITITDDRVKKATKALKPERKPKQEPGKLMKNLAVQMYSARKDNG